MKMMMKDDEILLSYREARNHLKQVGILADLNCVSRKEMAQWLVDHGQDVAKTFKTTEPEEAVEEEPEVVAEEEAEVIEEAAEELLKPHCVITADQAYSIAEFIDQNLFEAIRANPDWDSVQTLKNIIYAYDEMCKVSGYRGLTENYEQDS